MPSAALVSEILLCLLRPWVINLVQSDSDTLAETRTAGDGVVAIGVIAVVAYTLRPRETVAPPPPIEKLDPNIKVVTIAGDFIQFEGARQDLKIYFKRQSTTQDDQTKLADVKVVASNRSGRDYTITGKEMQVGKDESSFEVKGEVKLETSDGLIAHSEQATYSDAEKIVRAPGPVKFSRGRMSGTGIGFNFDEQRDTLTILEKADVHFAPEGKEGPMDVTAGALHLCAAGSLHALRAHHAHGSRAGN